MKGYRLFTPGPTDIPKDVLEATAHKCIYHREDRFRILLNEINEMLKRVIDCHHKIYLLTASGTGAMEAAYVNMVSESDDVVVAVCGKFGERWSELCMSYGKRPEVIRQEFGRSVPPEMIENRLRQIKKGAIVFTTLTETSTGALNDIKKISEIVKKYEGYLVVDGVAGIGADRFYQDGWGVDVIVGASQKALMSPPGISFVGINPRAFEKIKNSDTPKYYFNLNLYDKFLEKGQTPWTPAITILYGLKKGLEKIEKMGIEKNFDHHHKVAQYVRTRIHNMGYELFPENPSNGLTVIKMPEGMDSTEIIKECKEKHGILFANGQGEMKGKILRIGHMGNYNLKKMDNALNILEQVLRKKHRSIKRYH
ncbi:MAG: alanine--glyoxylate aminotransferase family protein [candidate division WOR-3 bacterium]|nr:alanine--glyoxylate aminotransferase family protein [candidate division WOR-3 bacterium]